MSGVTVNHFAKGKGSNLTRYITITVNVFIPCFEGALDGRFVPNHHELVWFSQLNLAGSDYSF